MWLCRLDRWAKLLVRGGRSGEPGCAQDHTGRVAAPDRPPRVVRLDDRLLLLWYQEKPAHSIWRSQEASLLAGWKALLQDPVLDFGCGDGSFLGSALGRASYGVDQDGVALARARELHAYESVVCAQGASLPFSDECFGSIVTNSVLEHCQLLEEVLPELQRVLKTGGLLILTVPTATWARHLTQYCGAETSARLNRAYVHRHLYEAEWWLDRLRENGFSIVAVRRYQPDWLTLWYLVLCTWMARQLWRRMLPEGLQNRLAGRLVRGSLESGAEGANVAIAARKAPPEGPVC